MSSMSVWIAVSLLLFSYAAYGEIERNKCDYGAVRQDDNYLLCVDGVGVVEVGQNTTLPLYLWPAQNGSVEIIQLDVVVEHEGIIDNPGIINVSTNGSNINIITIGAGRTMIRFNYTTDDESSIVIQNISLVGREVSVVHWAPLNIIIEIVGWIYFVAWSISFYPQIILNFKRRSVTGLSFDFLAMNITGFIAYSVFNAGLYWIPEVQHQYYLEHPGGVNPVQLNDVIFAFHATFATAFTIFQCVIFKRDKKQKVSWLGAAILLVLWLFVFIMLFLAVGSVINWLLFLTCFSYVKLAVTLIKYLPQVFLNFRRRSTVGWSIYNVLLDFTGGTFSVLQMFLISYNYEDWTSIFGDPTKFGLGMLSIFFDIIFMLQHYVCYRNRSDPTGYTKIDENIEKDDIVPPNNLSENSPLVSKNRDPKEWLKSASPEEPEKSSGFIEKLRKVLDTILS